MLVNYCVTVYVAPKPSGPILWNCTFEVGARENNGYVHNTKIALSDLPNDPIGVCDLECLEIDKINRPAIIEAE